MTAKLFIYFIFIITLLLKPLTAQTHIYADQISGYWSKAHSPYYIHQNIIIAGNSQLIIEAGVKVIFTGHYGLVVKGLLEAVGTNTDSIFFSSSDSLKGWWGIQFIHSMRENRIDYCTFRYGNSTSFIAEIYASEMRIIREKQINSGGGAIFCLNSRVSIVHCTFTQNSAKESGGAISCSYHSTMSVSHCKILNNNAMICGGGIFVLESGITIENCLIAGNSALKRGGGGIDSQHANVNVKNCTIRDNTSYSGGGIRCIYASTPFIDNCIIESNYSKYGGGIEFNENTNGELINTILIKNQAEFGGAICIVENSNPLVSNCEINENRARSKGGGIFVAEFGRPRISNCRITNNYSEADGGGILCLDVSPSLDSLLIKNNGAKNNGGGIYFEFAMPKLSGLNIYHNTAQKGGGIYFENCAGVYFDKNKRSNIYANTAEQSGNDLCLLNGPLIEAFLDTFTVAKPGDIHAYPLQKLKLNIQQAKLIQVNSDLYVSPARGNDQNSGLLFSQPLRTLNMAFSKIIADSLQPHVIFLDNGEYATAEVDVALSLKALKFVTLSSDWRSAINFAGDKIIVSTPWWKSYSALLLYFLSVTCLLIGSWYYQNRKAGIKQQLLLEHLQAEKLREMDNLKSRFFANISHEFRTPLTLIKGPVEQIVSGEFMGNLKEQGRLILRNINQLLNLVNQLLDLSKLEANKMQLQVQVMNLTPLMKGLVQSFASLAKRKNITLIFKPPKKQIELYLDREKFEKIINNLLSNAFKFTPEGGKVVVTAGTKKHPPVSPLDRGEGSISPLIKGDKGGCFEIMVSNTGPGIPPDQIARIFERFYQVDDSQTRRFGGTGIGLALVKELVELHHGEITVSSIADKETVFTICLPLGREAFCDQEIVAAVKEKHLKKAESPVESAAGDLETVTTTMPVHGRREKVLIVEDHVDVRHYIGNLLQEDYRILQAENGQAGLQVARAKMPDLIISDVMMPEMDGYAFCREVKNDPLISHIPLILLTARAGQEDKMEGLQSGADDFLIKPFDSRELLVRVNNLIEQRRNLRRRFSQEPNLPFNKITTTTIDEKFLNRLTEIIQNKISDPQLSVELLAGEIGISHSQLFRKLKAMVGLSPVAYIRLIRLTQAHHLLENKSGNISQVAFEVGFDSLQYFSRCFNRQYGISPSLFIKQNQD